MSDLPEMEECPFCGEKKHLEVMPDIDEEGRTYAFHVHCGVCGCNGRNNYPIGWCESREEAIEAWNHRGSVRPQMVFAANKVEKYSVEPHGPDGQFALYFGRNEDRHGARLCNLYDFDKNGHALRVAIVAALNENAHIKD